MTQTLILGGCRTFGTSAAIRPQRFIFHRLFDPWLWAKKPVKTVLAVVEFGYAALRERFDAESPTVS